ncbi:uncharacterized protein [Ptychodera flava]|uniref:uncharacterized protein n=1 Tax=Ptychodera flava TaxID=63121 RepID=UPI00396A3836
MQSCTECYFTMVICLAVTIKAEQTANTETNDPLAIYKAELDKARVKRTTTYVLESYSVRSVYQCGFLWWTECSRYHTAYRAKEVIATTPPPTGPPPVEVCHMWGRFCYPGNCPDAASQCTCMDGFSEYDCLRIDNPPSIDNCIVTVKNTNTREEKESPCSSSNTMPETVYVKDRSMTDVSVSWSTHFNPAEGQTYPTKPYYVEDFNVGVVDSSAQFTFQQPGLADVSNSYHCWTNFGNDNPISTRQSCQNDFTSTVQSVKDNSSLIVGVSAVNGGFIRMLIEFWGFSFDRNEYYHGRRFSMIARFVYDLEAPYHCSLKPGSTCLDKMLDIGVGYTNQSAININWSGWMDDISGVEKYEIEIFPSVPGNGTLGCSPNADESQTFNKDVTSVTVNLHEPDVYCVLLVVSDKAENHRYAMRYLLFDDQYTVDIMPHYPMMVVSARYTRDTYWQINGENMVK